MKKTILLCLLFVLSVGLFSQKGEEWTRVDVPEIYSFRIPPSFELRDKESYAEYFAEGLYKYYKIPYDKTRIVIQPRGFKDGEYFPAKLYFRLIINYRVEDCSDVSDEIEKLSEQELKELTVADQKELRSGLSTLENNPIIIKKISNTTLKKIGNRTSVYYSYIRESASDTNSEVLVHFYRIFNKNNYIEVRVSYRTDESDIWEDDFIKCLESFIFTNNI